jgi:hypothetical protein
MPKRSSNKPRLPDPNRLAVNIVQAVTGKPPREVLAEPSADSKNPAAVALGKLGGKKGGPARAAKLSKRRLSQIAKMAAQTRWSKKGKKPAHP